MDEARRGVSAGTQNQAFNALVFFDKAVLGQPLGTIAAVRASRKEHVRVALEVGETRALLAAVGDQAGYPTRLVAHLLYGKRGGNEGNEEQKTDYSLLHT